MDHRRLLGVGMAALMLSLVIASGGVQHSSLAQGVPNRAAIVFRLGSGQVIVRVVSFEGPSITGLDLARASGLPIVAWSNLVCKIASQGCDNPSTYDECFCQCTSQSGGCDFWRYFHWKGGEWQFSGTGAAEYAVPPDGIDGWAWGDDAARPTEIDPAAIWDARRLAPGTVRAAAVGGILHVQVDSQGDENHNSVATARYRRTDDTWDPEIISLMRLDNVYSGESSAPLRPGTYEISLVFSDQDGINGSASITETVEIAGSQRIYLPMLLASSGPP